MVITSRPSPYAVVALAGFAALSLAACGSSSTSSAPSSATSGSTPTSAAAAPAPAPGGHDGKDWVDGLVSAVSGGTVNVTGRQGPATINITGSTRIVQLSAAQLTDVTQGECIQVHPTKDSSSAPTVTAAAVLVGQPAGNQCGHKGGNQQHGVAGTVASVNGNSIVVTEADNSTATVTVTANTRYEKRSDANASAIATGVCLAAHGTKDSSGVLQAAGATVRPAVNGSCGGGRPQH
ncbi:hypothetical protein A5784_34090 [Mycobacterium sp. 852013-50091_SCH5140682]|uniref:DUF5666 domain-containing protein n=1 Tax=Mycobacterium sp. 852013-50091_SCH5140682 TaxID=1834109 RepID=UPI0007E94AB4|nr:DUF5666 domain-containing protein [Mycobacterium sp. 852013-50091_SCH5140682]OBC11552.1 hypothetical protein A5784_34090 [Mycobacterium sp. 852013-50091_SCH5140682]